MARYRPHSLWMRWESGCSASAPAPRPRCSSTCACALLLTLFGFAFRGRRTPLPAYLVGSAAVLLTTWLAFYAGAGPFASQIAGAPTRLMEVPSGLANVTQLARYGFLASGGNTNIV